MRAGKGQEKSCVNKPRPRRWFPPSVRFFWRGEDQERETFGPLSHLLLLLPLGHWFPASSSTCPLWEALFNLAINWEGSSCNELLYFLAVRVVRNLFYDALCIKYKSSGKVIAPPRPPPPPPPPPPFWWRMVMENGDGGGGRPGLFSRGGSNVSLNKKEVEAITTRGEVWWKGQEERGADTLVTV